MCVRQLLNFEQRLFAPNFATIIALYCLQSSFSCGHAKETPRSTSRDGTAQKSINQLGKISQSIEIPASETMKALLDEEDCDKDKRITIKDRSCRHGIRGDQRFAFFSTDKVEYLASGTYQLAVLVEELADAKEKGLAKLTLHPPIVRESPVERINRRIREDYWSALTRRLDLQGLRAALGDTKVSQGKPYYLYISEKDPHALSYYRKLEKNHPELAMKVVAIESPPSAELARKLSLSKAHGLLGLAFDDKGSPLPFVVPGGRYNEMYGWDSYFIVLGLIRDQKFELAKAMVEHFAYQIQHYGKILNANRSYMLNRSQPPLMTASLFAVLNAWPPTRKAERTPWLHRMLEAAMQEYALVWGDKRRKTHIGLTRYFGQGGTPYPPPETEPGHFHEAYRPFAEKRNMSVEEYEKDYREGRLREPALDRYFVHDRCVRESGHDTTYRWHVEGKDRCADFATVELNALLYQYEVDIADLIANHFQSRFVAESGKKHTASAWNQLAANRKKLMRKHLWDEKERGFYDFNLIAGKRHKWVSASGFFALWAGRGERRLLSRDEAKDFVATLKQALLAPGGLAGSQTHPALPDTRQWDHPFGWPPHQVVAWIGLRNYGMVRLAQEVAYRWLHTVVHNASRFHGVIPEKFDVMKRSHAVYVEYGNVGTDFEYITREGFGWMNTSIQEGIALLSQEQYAALKKLKAPSSLDFLGTR